MSEWTDLERAAIKNTVAKIDSEAVGSAAFSRYLLAFPWTQKFYEKFGNLSNADAIKSNPNVIAHGKAVMAGLAQAAQNLDNIKAINAEQSVLQKLQMDPGNSKPLADSITVEVANRVGKDFTPEVHAAFQKFMDVTVSTEGKQNH